MDSLIFVQRVSFSEFPSFALKLRRRFSPNGSVYLPSQSLVLSFLHLMNSQLQITLDFLSGVPDPTGKSALEYVVKIWCSRQPEFFGVYDSKVR